MSCLVIRTINQNQSVNRIDDNALAGQQQQQHAHLPLTITIKTEIIFEPKRKWMKIQRSIEPVSIFYSSMLSFTLIIWFIGLSSIQRSHIITFNNSAKWYIELTDRDKHVKDPLSTFRSHLHRKDITIFGNIQYPNRHIYIKATLSKLAWPVISMIQIWFMIGVKKWQKNNSKKNLNKIQEMRKIVAFIYSLKL